MSSQQPITLEEALAQLSALEEQIARLQAALADVERRIATYSAIEDAIKGLSDGAEDALIPLSTGGEAFVKGSIAPVKKVAVHAGLDVYVELSPEKAIEHLRKLQADYSKIAELYRGEIARLAQYYNALRAAVEEALSRAQQQSQ